mgnify:CR=1 FL=1
MIEENQTLSSKDFSKGLVTRADILKPQFDQSPNCMNIKWFYDGAIGKRLGSSTTNSVVIGSTTAAGWTLDASGDLSTSIGAFWKLDESSGNRSDSFGTNVLTDNNTVTSITGIRNNAALFADVNSESLVRQTTSPLQSTSNCTLSAWVYLNSTSTTIQRTIIGKRDPDIDVATVLLLHCDGADGSTTFTDSSPSGKTVTAVGNAQVDTAQSQFGGASCLLDGTGDYLTLVDSDDWNFGSGNFTIDCWIRSAITTVFAIYGQSTDTNNYHILYWTGTQWRFIMNGVEIFAITDSISINTWYHIALVRNGTVFTMYKDGSSVGTGSSGSSYNDFTGVFNVGRDAEGVSNPFNGHIDEFRVTKGIARWVANFTVPARAYGLNDFEYWLFINTNNQVTFRVSNTGTNSTATVQAASAGALNTSTWYRIIGWHSSGQHIGVDVNLSVNTTLYTTGMRIGSAPFTIGALSDSITGSATNYFDGRIDEVGFWQRGLSVTNRSDLYGGGSGNTYSAGASSFGWAMFDFGASSLRWLTVAAGTGIMASSNRGTTFVAVGTTRTQNYQYFERSRNVLIATADSYDVPMYWAGSAGTSFIALAVNSAPSAKYAINYQGFLVLLNFQNSNGTLRSRGFAYNDENTQLTSAWPDSFDIPSSQDDEITSGFILSKFLYVSTKTKLFRVAYVGGNPDWSYLKVKDWGFVPRTAKLMTLRGGQVVVGMDWDRRIRAFDGYEDVFVSDNVENDNGICDFATSKISLAGSGLVLTHAEVDQIEQEYRLNLALGMDSTQTTHAIVLNGRTLSLYPYSNQQYQAMCVAESGNTKALMAVDRSGFVHILNSGNRDVNVAIDDQYDSPILFGNTPQEVMKSQNINAYFKVDSCGQVYYRDRVNLSNEWSELKNLTNLTRGGTSLIVETALDTPATFNTYQFNVTSSSGTANPWKMSRWDFIGQVKGMGRG